MILIGLLKLRILYLNRDYFNFRLALEIFFKVIRKAEQETNINFASSKSIFDSSNKA